MMPFAGGIEDVSNGALLLSAAAALLYLFALEQPASWKRSAVKTLPVLLLAFVALNRDGPALLVAGLVLGAAGDFFLSRDGDNPFLAGLASFLLAHIAYVVLFLGSGGGLPVLVGWHVVAALAIAAFSLSVLVLLMRHVPANMRMPVVAYCIAIVLMGLTALTTGNWMVIAGALLFMASDTLLALERFVLPETFGHRLPVRVAVWTFYYAAQLLITLGFVLA